MIQKTQESNRPSLAFCSRSSSSSFSLIMKQRKLPTRSVATESLFKYANLTDIGILGKHLTLHQTFLRRKEVQKRAFLQTLQTNHRRPGLQFWLAFFGSTRTREEDIGVLPQGKCYLAWVEPFRLFDFQMQFLRFPGVCLV
jgi:hypothetical protein